MKQKVVLPAIVLLLTQSGFSQNSSKIGVRLTGNCSDQGTTLSVDNIHNKIKVYPNPSRENFQIDVYEEGADMNLIDLNGKKILAEQLDMGTNKIVLPDLEKGTYVIRIRLKETVRISKLNIQ